MIKAIRPLLPPRKLTVQEQATHIVGRPLGSGIGKIVFVDKGEGVTGENYTSWREKIDIDWGTIVFGYPGALECNPRKIMYPFGVGRRVAWIRGVKRIEEIHMDTGGGWMKVFGTVHLELIDRDEFDRQLKAGRDTKAESLQAKG